MYPSTVFVVAITAKTIIAPATRPHILKKEQRIRMNVLEILIA